MINFLKYRYVCMVFSVAFLAIGVGAFFYNKATYGSGFAYDIDFTGGTEFRVSFTSPVEVDVIRDAIPSGYTLQSIGQADDAGTYKEFMLRTAADLEKTPELENSFKSYVAQHLPENPMRVESISSVGSEVGKDIQWNSLVSVLLAMLFILIYIGIRSQARFAFGAVVALAHDMLAVLVVFLIFREQISVHVLAAVLAILGYSLNDTIVIFSRIRENFRKMPHASEYEIVNLSINQTLRRTLLTSISTLLTVLAIFFFGGEVLHGFSLAMLVGVVAGTYSSVYIASPVMLALSSSKK